MLDADKGIIDSAFLVDLFQMILGDKKNEMSPQQMVEYVNERGIILAPTLVDSVVIILVRSTIVNWIFYPGFHRRPLCLPHSGKPRDSHDGIH